ncbi:MAG: extracellular solute-binding protein [Aquiluna sp.]|nr:extracellular solute-binding protein [Aquiluna sp.]
MHKIISVPIAIASILTLAACAGAGSSGGSTDSSTGTTALQDSPRELLIWVDIVREPAAKMYAEKMAGEIDVTVEVVAQEEMLPKIALANQTGSGWPDLLFAPPNDIAIWADASNGYALALDDYLDPSIIEGYEGSNDWCLIEGQYYCLKNDLAQTVLWYDTVLFDELGLTIPTTFSEFSTEAMKLKGTGYVAGAIGDQGFYSGYLWPSGCPMTSVQDGTTVRINPDTPECSRVWKEIQPLVDAGVLDTRSAFDAGFIADVANAGKVAMHIGPSWWGEFVIRPADSWGIEAGRISAAPMPKWSGESINYSGEWGGGIWAVSSNAVNPQDAVDAIVYLATSVEVAKDGVTFPGFKPAYEAWSARLDADPYYAISPVAAMKSQASKIRQTEKPVRFNAQGQIGATLQAGLNGGETVEKSVRSFLDSLQQLAPGGGYTVID